MRAILVEITFNNGKTHTAWYERFATNHTANEILSYSFKSLEVHVCDKNDLEFTGDIHYMNVNQIQSIVLLKEKEIPDANANE